MKGSYISEVVVAIPSVLLVLWLMLFMVETVDGMA
jgi:hypothetical protein